MLVHVAARLAHRLDRRVERHKMRPVPAQRQAGVITSYSIHYTKLYELLYGHHTSAHRLVHHRFVATPGDPNTAALGESFWSFVPRAWGGAFIAGYEMESTLRDHQTPRGEARRFGDRLAGLHPYLSYVLGALWFVLLMGLVFGFWGVISSYNFV